MEGSDNEKTDWLDVLKRARDELRLKMHLASMEAREEFERLDRQLDKLDARVRPKAERAAMALDETASQIARDLKAGFELLRESLREPGDESSGE